MVREAQTTFRNSCCLSLYFRRDSFLQLDCYDRLKVHKWAHGDLSNLNVGEFLINQH